MSEPLPMHGIHYWEFKIRARRDQSVEPDTLPTKEEDPENGLSQQTSSLGGGTIPGFSFRNLQKKTKVPK